MVRERSRTGLAAPSVLSEGSGAAWVLNVAVGSTIVELNRGSVDHGAEGHKRDREGELHDNEALILFEIQTKARDVG